MSIHLNRLALGELIYHLNRLAEEWDEVDKRRVTIAHELNVTRDDLQRARLHLETLRSTYERELDFNREILGRLERLVTRFGTGSGTSAG
jgi:hypothetical protein